jgi:hypothetical protein
MMMYGLANCKFISEENCAMTTVIIWRTVLHNISLGKEVMWDIMERD